MKKTPIALSAAVFLVALAGCSAPSDDGAPSSPASSSSSPAPSASSSVTATATPTPTPTADAIAPGFPIELIPAMDGATVLTTSFEEESDLVTVSMTGRTTATAEEVAAWYAKAFEERGFFPLTGDTVGDTVSRDFVRDGGAETANVSVVPEEDGSVFTVGANVLPSTAQGARP